MKLIAALLFCLLVSVVMAAVPVITVDGPNVVITQTATGVEPLAYQWYKNDNPIALATTHSISIPKTAVGVYYIKVTAADGGVAVGKKIRISSTTSTSAADCTMTFKK